MRGRRWDGGSSSPPPSLPFAFSAPPFLGPHTAPPRPQGVASLRDLREVFGRLDRLRDVLATTLEGWQPPQLVVMGGESSGKSTLLARLAMMPLFPAHHALCTRLPIHVRLRHCSALRQPRLEVRDADTGALLEGPWEVGRAAPPLPQTPPTSLPSCPPPHLPLCPTTLPASSILQAEFPPLFLDPSRRLLSTPSLPSSLFSSSPQSRGLAFLPPDAVCSSPHPRLLRTLLSLSPPLSPLPRPLLSLPLIFGFDRPPQVPMGTGQRSILAKMEELVWHEENQRRGVHTGRILVVHVDSPGVPSLDLVDLPGLVQSPADMAAATEGLVRRYVRAHGAHSIFLVAVPAAHKPNDSKALAMVHELGVQGRTIGVLTMADELPKRRHGQLRERLAGPPPGCTEEELREWLNEPLAGDAVRSPSLPPPPFGSAGFPLVPFARLLSSSPCWFRPVCSPPRHRVLPPPARSLRPL